MWLTNLRPDLKLAWTPAKKRSRGAGRSSQPRDAASVPAVLASLRQKQSAPLGRPTANVDSALQALGLIAEDESPRKGAKRA
jgi:hypothetical protein